MQGTATDRTHLGVTRLWVQSLALPPPITTAQQETLGIKKPPY